MNTHDKIELPPLPTPPSLIQRKDWYGAIQAYARSYGMECVRTAIEADRKRRQSEAEAVCAEAYQVVGSLLSDLGIFGTDEAEKILDNLSQARMVHKDVLPWRSHERKRRGEPVFAWYDPTTGLFTRNKDDPDSGIPAGSCLWPLYREAPTLHNSASGAPNADQAPQPAKPVGYINPAHIGQGHGSGIFWKADQNFPTPVYVLPQPAETVKVPSDDELKALAMSVKEPGPDGFILRYARALLARYGQPAEPVTCPICSEDEAHTGTCGSNDPMALCKALGIEGFCLHEAHREHKHKTGEDCTCPKYIRHPSCVQHEVRKYLPSKNPWGVAPQPAGAVTHQGYQPIQSGSLPPPPAPMGIKPREYIDHFGSMVRKPVEPVAESERVYLHDEGYPEYLDGARCQYFIERGKPYPHGDPVAFVYEKEDAEKIVAALNAQPAESVKVPPGYVLIAEDYLEAMIGPERMDHLRRSCRFPAP